MWLNRQLLRWPGIDTTGVHKLYWSAKGSIQASVGAALSGHDGAITLEATTGTVPEPWATRFKWVGAGATLAVKAGDLAQLATLHRAQLVLYGLLMGDKVAPPSSPSAEGPRPTWVVSWPRPGCAG